MVVLKIIVRSVITNSRIRIYAGLTYMLHIVHMRLWIYIIITNFTSFRLSRLYHPQSYLRQLIASSTHVDGVLTKSILKVVLL